jgi:hypothetical protein
MANFPTLAVCCLVIKLLSSLVGLMFKIVFGDKAIS